MKQTYPCRAWYFNVKSPYTEYGTDLGPYDSFETVNKVLKALEEEDDFRACQNWHIKIFSRMLYCQPVQGKIESYEDVLARWQKSRNDLAIPIQLSSAM